MNVGERCCVRVCGDSVPRVTLVGHGGHSAESPTVSCDTLSFEFSSSRRSAAACSRRDAATRDAKPTNASAASATAAGTLAASALRDTISDRADRGRILGDSTAKVWLIMASDFQCPFCKQWHDAAFAGLMQDYVQQGEDPGRLSEFSAEHTPVRASGRRSRDVRRRAEQVLAGARGAVRDAGEVGVRQESHAGVRFARHSGWREHDSCTASASASTSRCR